MDHRFNQLVPEHHFHLHEAQRQAAQTSLQQQAQPAATTLADHLLAKVGDWMIAEGQRLKNRLETLPPTTNATIELLTN